MEEMRARPGMSHISSGARLPTCIARRQGTNRLGGFARHVVIYVIDSTDGPGQAVI